MPSTTSPRISSFRCCTTDGRSRIPMTIDPKEAASALGDVAAVERRTREALYYSGASIILVLWGVAWAVGHTITFAAPPLATTAWMVINIVGTVASLLIGFARSRR